MPSADAPVRGGTSVSRLSARRRSRAREEEPLLSREMRCPLEMFGAREAQVRAECVVHRVDEPVGAARCEAVLPPNVEDVDASIVAVDAWFDPADEAVAEDDREHVVA